MSTKYVIQRIRDGHYCRHDDGNKKARRFPWVFNYNLHLAARFDTDAAAQKVLDKYLVRFGSTNYDGYRIIAVS